MWQNVVFQASIKITGSFKPRPSQVDGADSLSEELRNLDLGAGAFYGKLDQKKLQIRLLTLYPGEPSDTLQCGLETAFLDDPLRDEYEALSYCWGDITSQNLMELKHHKPKDESNNEFRPFSVHSSLYNALVHLRPSSGPPRKVWADAICINQADAAERAQQVTAMTLIYKHAKRVVIWLGLSTPRRQDCIKQIQGIQSKFEEACQPSKVYTAEEWYQTLGEVAAAIVKDREDAMNFLQRWAECDFDWFRRTWVLQEAVNSRETIVFCGDDRLDWEILCSLEILIQKAKKDGRWNTYLMQSIMPPPFLTFANLATGKENRKRDPPVQQGILETVINAHVMKATDPRDKLFAMLQFGEDTSGIIGINLDQKDPRIQPNYMKDSKTVFCDFVRWWIETHKSLRILSAVHTLRYRSWQQMYSGEPLDVASLTYPTWSLSLAQGGDADWAKGTLGLEASSPYRASGHTEPNIMVEGSQDSHILRISGHRLCKIQEISPFPYWHPFSPETVWTEMREVFRHIFDPTATRKAWQFGGNDEQEEGSRYSQEEKDNLDMRHWACHGQNYNEKRDSILPCISPCLFIAGGNLAGYGAGLCPHNAQIGDIVVMLFGGAVLYLLREKQEPKLEGIETSNTDQPQYYFVGECYLYSYMNGRALEEANAVDQAPEIFNLI